MTGRRLDRFPMASSSLSLTCSLFLLTLTLLLHFCTLTQQTGTPHLSLSFTTSKLILEEGYTVSTVLDGDKLPDPINPSYFLPRLSGSHDLVVLDSPKSLFYTVSLPISQDSVINRFSGNGTGFADGELGSAMFNRPQSFAVDGKGNVYVADRNNHAIRKISPSGVTTVAGGHSSGKPGNVDGPAQDASFSNNFELTFVPDICALLINDRGNRLIRQMNLKSADCGSGSSSQFQMGLALSALLGVSCLLLGLVTGGVTSYCFRNSRTDKHPQTAVLRDMEALPNSSGETSFDSLLRHQKRSC